MKRANRGENRESKQSPGAPSAANHNPLAVLNGDRTTDVIVLTANPDSIVNLSAAGTDAGDEGQTVKVTWWIYAEAGNSVEARLTEVSGLRREVVLPARQEKMNDYAKGSEVHVIMQVEDDGAPHLFSYRRAIIQVVP